MSGLTKGEIVSVSWFDTTEEKRNQKRLRVAEVRDSGYVFRGTGESDTTYVFDEDTDWLCSVTKGRTLGNEVEISLT